MSLRGAGGTVTPGYNTGMSFAASGSRIRLRNVSLELKRGRSPLGSELLKKSLNASGMTTSLTSGIPRRETCTGALSVWIGVRPAERTVTRDRLEVDQTPMI